MVNFYLMRSAAVCKIIHALSGCLLAMQFLARSREAAKANSQGREPLEVKPK
jgi:hypothetical protein